jgi:hypothetical protein
MESGDSNHTEIKQLPKVAAQRNRDDNMSNAKIDKVNDEHGNGCKSGNEDLVSPANIEKIIPHAKQGNGLQRHDRRQEGR